MFSSVKLWHKSSLYFMFKYNGITITFYPKEYFTIIDYLGETWVTSWGYNTMQQLQDANIPTSKVPKFKEYLGASFTKLEPIDEELIEYSKKNLLVAITNTVNKYPDILGLENILAEFFNVSSSKTISKANYTMYIESAFDSLDNKNKEAKDALLNLVNEQDKYNKQDIVDSYWYLFETLKKQKIIDKMINPPEIDNSNKLYVDDEITKKLNKEEINSN